MSQCDAPTSAHKSAGRRANVSGVVVARRGETGPETAATATTTRRRGALATDRCAAPRCPSGRSRRSARIVLAPTVHRTRCRRSYVTGPRGAPSPVRPHPGPTRCPRGRPSPPRPPPSADFGKSRPRTSAAAHFFPADPNSKWDRRTRTRTPPRCRPICAAATATASPAPLRPALVVLFVPFDPALSCPSLVRTRVACERELLRDASRAGEPEVGADRPASYGDER